MPVGARDRRLLSLIGRVLKAGVMIEGLRSDTDEGVAQGLVLSPLLAGTDAKRWSADDFICAFALESDARRCTVTFGITTSTTIGGVW